MLLDKPGDVSDPLREASLGLGIPRWKTIVKVVLPAAQAGIMTGVVLSVARADRKCSCLRIGTTNTSLPAAGGWPAKVR